MQQSLNEDFQQEFDSMNKWLTQNGHGLAIESAPTAMGKSYQAQANLYRHAIDDLQNISDKQTILDCRKYIWMSSHKSNILQDVDSSRNNHYALFQQLQNMRQSALGLKKKKQVGVLQLKSKADLFKDPALLVRSGAKNSNNEYAVHASLMSAESSLFKAYQNKSVKPDQLAKYRTMSQLLTDFLEAAAKYQAALDKNDLVLIKERFDYTNSMFNKFHRQFQQLCRSILNNLDDASPKLGLKVEVTDDDGKTYRRWNVPQCAQYLTNHLGQRFVSRLYPQLRVPEAQIISLTVDKAYLSVSTVVSGSLLGLDWIKMCASTGANQQIKPLLIVDELSMVKDTWNKMLFAGAAKNGLHIGRHGEPNQFDVISLVRLFKNQLTGNTLHYTQNHTNYSEYDKLASFYQNPLMPNSAYQLAVKETGFHSRYVRRLRPLVEFFEFVKKTHADGGFRIGNEADVPEASYQQMFVTMAKVMISSNVLRQSKTLVYHPVKDGENVINVLDKADSRIVSLDRFDPNQPDQYLELATVIGELQKKTLYLWHAIYRYAGKAWPNLDINARLTSLFRDLSKSEDAFLKHNVQQGSQVSSLLAVKSKTADQDDFYNTGLDYFRTAMSDADGRVYLEWIRVNTTPEALLQELATELPVIGLSADLEFPTSLGHFNYQWVMQHVGSQNVYQTRKKAPTLYQDILGWVNLKNVTFAQNQRVAPRIDRTKVLLNDTNWSRGTIVNKVLHDLVENCGLKAETVLTWLGPNVDRTGSINDANAKTRGRFVHNLQILLSSLDFLAQSKKDHGRQRSLLVLNNYAFKSRDKAVIALDKLIIQYGQRLVANLDPSDRFYQVWNKSLTTPKNRKKETLITTTLVADDFHIRGVQHYLHRKNQKSQGTKQSKWDQLRNDLADGKLRIVLSTYASVGTGTNVTYPVPEDLVKIENVAPAEFKIASSDHRVTTKDFDGLCLMAPTNIMPSLGQADKYGDFTVEATCRALCETMELGQPLGVSTKTQRDHAELKKVQKAIQAQAYLRMNQRVLKDGTLAPITKAGDYVNPRNTDAFHYQDSPVNVGWHITQVVLQALGRVNRTFRKAAPLQLYLDDKFIQYEQQSLLHFEELANGDLKDRVSYCLLNPIEQVFTETILQKTQEQLFNQVTEKAKHNLSLTKLSRQAIQRTNQSNNQWSMLLKSVVRSHQQTNQHAFELRNVIADATLRFGPVLSKAEHDRFNQSVVEQLRAKQLTNDELRRWQLLLDPYFQVDQPTNHYYYDERNNVIGNLSFDDQRPLPNVVDFRQSQNLAVTLGQYRSDWQEWLPTVDQDQVGDYVLNPLFYRSLFNGHLGEHVIRNHIWPELVQALGLPEITDYYTEAEYQRTQLDLRNYRETFDGWLKTDDQVKVFVDMKVYRSRKNLGNYWQTTVKPKVLSLQQAGVKVAGILFLNVVANDQQQQLTPQVDVMPNGVQLGLVPTMMKEQLASQTLTSNQYFGQLKEIVDQMLGR